MGGNAKHHRINGGSVLLAAECRRTQYGGAWEIGERPGKIGPGHPSQRWVSAPQGRLRGCSVTQQPPTSTKGHDPAEKSYSPP
jgi:hypothetical protein